MELSILGLNGSIYNSEFIWVRVWVRVVRVWLWICSSGTLFLYLFSNFDFAFDFLFDCDFLLFFVFILIYVAFKILFFVFIFRCCFLLEFGFIMHNCYFKCFKCLQFAYSLKVSIKNAHCLDFV